ncbi:MAG: hypothetical protein ACRDRJ_00055 [Streptosporangiaceae bacterium]
MSKRKRRRSSPPASTVGRGGTAGPAGELHLVTVAELSPDEYPGELGTSYSQACGALSLPASPGAYALLLELDDDGARWTRASTDVRGIRTLQSIWNSGAEAGYQPPGRTVAAVLPGWPVECVLGLAGLPEPHDPPGTTPLRPPPAGWSPARRRAMTDQVASELAASGHQSAEDYHQARQWQHWNLGESNIIPQQPRLIDRRLRLAADHPARPAADQAITAAWRLAATAKPPPGSVRAGPAWPRPARVIRAAGDRWSLAGRTGGPVILLIDEAPAIPLDISDSPRTAELLDALTPQPTAPAAPDRPRAGDPQGSVRCLSASFTALSRFATIRYMAGTERMSAAGAAARQPQPHVGRHCLPAG